MSFQKCLSCCALAVLMFGSVAGCETAQRINRGDGPSSDHYLFSVEDPIPGDAWTDKRPTETEHDCL